MSTRTPASPDLTPSHLAGWAVNSHLAVEGIYAKANNPMQNNDAALSRFLSENGTDFIAWYAAQLKKVGPPPSTRKVAVAHEVGHAVIAMSLGGTTTDVSVYRDSRGRWCGWTETSWPPSVEQRIVKVLEDPLEATHAALTTIAGLIGEEIAGLGHPASSPDEMYRVVQAAVTVAHFKRLDAEELLARVMHDARQRILLNQGLFKAIRRSLNATDTLPTAAIMALVEQHGVVQVPLKAAW